MSDYPKGNLDVPVCDHCLREIKVGDKYVEFIADKPLCKSCLNRMSLENLLWYFGESVKVRVEKKPAKEQTEPPKEFPEPTLVSTEEETSSDNGFDGDWREYPYKKPDDKQKVLIYWRDLERVSQFGCGRSFGIYGIMQYNADRDYFSNKEARMSRSNVDSYRPFYWKPRPEPPMPDTVSGSPWKDYPNKKPADKQKVLIYMKDYDRYCRNACGRSFGNQGIMDYHEEDECFSNNEIALTRSELEKTDGICWRPLPEPPEDWKPFQGPTNGGERH